MDSNRCIAPLAISSLTLVLAIAPAWGSTATAFSIRWTAPGDDSLTGRASAYDLRYSSLPITAANFQQATRILGLPAPAVAGASESFVVSGLADGVLHYLAIKTADESGNWSKISNVLTRSGQATTGVDPSTLALSFSSPWPNPARLSVSWAYSMPQPASVQVDVFDVTGHHIHTIATGERGAGRSDLSWDLRDDRGHRVDAGVYFVKARLGSTEWTRRLVVLR